MAEAGGGGGIRTHGTREGTTVFETGLLPRKIAGNSAETQRSRGFRAIVTGVSGVNASGSPRRKCRHSSRLTKPAPFRISLRRPLSNQTRKTVHSVNRHHARALRSLSVGVVPKAAGVATGLNKPDERPARTLQTQEGSARLLAYAARRGGQRARDRVPKGLSPGPPFPARFRAPFIPREGKAAAARHSRGSFGCPGGKGLAGWVGAALSRPAVG